MGMWQNIFIEMIQVSMDIIYITILPITNVYVLSLITHACSCFPIQCCTLWFSYINQNMLFYYKTWSVELQQPKWGGYKVRKGLCQNTLLAPD